jgi:MEDS: MEthanogen/methylotroph, DcmR Sensory domain
VSSCPELLDRLHSEEHVVQLYGADDRLLTRNVGRFLSEGLKRGDGLLVIATPEHRTTLARHLREVPAYSKAVLEGRLVFLDAEVTLGRLMLNGAPDPELFRSLVGEALNGVRARAGGSGVRAYGEMVGLLWKAGVQEAAIQLEELWNALLKSSDVTLFCGYPIDVFGEDFRPEKVDPLLRSHTHLLPLDPALEQALTLAMEEVLGPRLDELPDLSHANHRPAWGQIPRAEAMVLWLRNNLPGSADQILARAREHYRGSEVRGLA